MGMYIEDEYGDGYEQFQELDFDEKWNFLIDYMIEVQHEVRELATKIGEYYRVVNSQREEIKELTKNVLAVDVKRKVIRKVLKTGILPNAEMFRKEKDRLLEITKGLGKVMYV